MTVELELPQLIAERFAARPPLAGGRCRAVDVEDGAWVMLALIEGGGAGRAGFTRRVRAVKKAAKVEHVGLAKLRALVQGGSTIGVATELPVGGQTLAERVTANGTLSVDGLRALAADVCAALSFAHEKGLRHGRLDANSVVLAKDGGWLIADLPGAFARASDEVDERTDVRGVGALLYYAATGTPPFEAPALSMPPEVRAVALRCLQQDPDRRYGRLADIPVALGGGPQARLRAQTARRPSRRRAWLAWLAALAVVGGAAGVGGPWAWRRFVKHGAATPPPQPPGTRPALDAGVAAVMPPDATPAPARPRTLLAISRVTAPKGANFWMGRAVTEMLITALDDAPDFEVLAPPFDPAPLAEAARNGEPALVVSGSVEVQGATLWIDLRLYDAHSSATVYAERLKLAAPDALIADIDGAIAKLRASVRNDPPGAHGFAELATASAPACRAYVEGLAAYEAGDRDAAVKDWRKAAGLDPKFFHPRARLAQLGDAAALAEARPLAAHAGSWGGLALRRLDARTPAALVDALAALTARYPRDAGLAAELAAAYRRAGRAADCITEGERARALGTANADVDMVWCRLESGDGPGALAAAQKLPATTPNAILVGDVAAMQARWGDARTAYRKAYEAGDKHAGARLALVEANADGKCKGTVHANSEEDARIWASLSLLCGDFAGVREAETWARQTLKVGHPGEDIAALLAGARYDKAAYAQLRERALDASRWSPEGLDRARRYGPLLATARAAGKAAEALNGLAVAPLDRHPLYEPPLLLDIAFAQIDVGDGEDAALACQEILTAAPGYVPGHWCLGRAADAQKDYATAIREYREVLDRWSDADADNRVLRDAKRRIVESGKKAAAAAAHPPTSQPTPP